MKKVAIFGLGLMGGSLAAAIKKFVPDVEIYGFDREKILDKALEQGYIDHKIQEITSLPEDLNIAFAPSRAMVFILSMLSDRI